MKSYTELGYRDVDEAYLENYMVNPHHFHYYDSGMKAYKKEYIHLYKINNMDNKNAVGKYIIVKDLKFTDFMKDDDGNIAMYDSMEDASLVCGMYEFPNVLILKVEYNHIEDDTFVSMHDKLK